MALIEIYHVVADMYPVDVDWTNPIIEGQCVRLTAGGQAARATGGVGTRTMGLAGDSMTTTVPTAANPHTPYSAALTVNGAGGTQWTQNRVSDAFNETLASGMITVYNGGGKFATTEYEILAGAAPIAYGVGNALYSSANGRLTNVASVSAVIVADVVGTPAAYPSGVPGTAVQSSMSLGTYMTVVLRH